MYIMALYKKSKLIQFLPFTDMAAVVTEPPSPAKNHMPEAYKKLPYKIDKSGLHKSPNWINSNLTVKACMPVFDTFTSGYMLTTLCDLVVTDNEKYEHRIYWDVDWIPIKTHGSVQIGDLSSPPGFEREPFKFETQWIIKTPPGYSVLITHPFNRFDLPFFTLSGIVDSDTYNFLPVNLPFFLKENFIGIIPKGTPIAQVLPFKREEWKSKSVEYDPATGHQINRLKSIVERHYKNKFWFKKNYE